MKKKIFTVLLKILSNYTHKKFLYINKDAVEKRSYAVKSNHGFWYSGNIFDQSDIVYGVLANGTVEEYDTNLVKKILTTLKPDFIFYDIGSNTGWYTMLAASISKEIQVYSFEPLEEHIKTQKETIFLNRKDDQVTIFELALSNHQGKETIRLAGSGTSLEQDFLEADFGTRVIEINTLDTLTNTKKLPKPDFIKIDVEGYEYKVLEGSKTVIEDSLPILFIEIAKTFSARNFVNKDYEKLFEMLTGLGYTPYLANKSLRKFSYTEPIDGVHMFLFLHNEKHISIKKLLSVA